MRKKMLFMASVICFFSSAAMAVDLFSDGFESGNFTAGGWTTQNSDAAVTSRSANTGAYGAELAVTTWMEKAISTVGYTDIHVKYYRETKRFDAGENLYVEWDDGSTWNSLETIQSANYGDGLQDKLCGTGANQNASFKIRFRTNANKVNEYAFIDDVVISGTSTVVDTDPPTPDPATFASPPAAVSSSQITMTATTGSDASPPVEYYFAETSGNTGGTNSGWTTNPVYTDSGLQPSTQYTYTVQMRDSLGNTGTASAPASATTQPAPPDTHPPTPNPATFASPPAAVTSTLITMTATTGSDASPPVEYYFDETSGNPGGTDSGWTTNPMYNDSGLQPNTLYSYTVQMRDSLGNTGTASAPASVTTADATGVAEYYLRAGTTTKLMPDGQDVVMWGFAPDSSFGAMDGEVNVPGPLLTVPPDNGLRVILDNDLPDTNVSIIIPGQIDTIMTPVKFTDAKGRPRIRSFTHVTKPNNTVPVVYEWNSLRPGTYLYHSGTHPAVQVQMGLYGCLTKDAEPAKVKGATVRNAYVDVPYDAEVILCFSEIDPVLHQAVADGNYGPGKPMTSTMDYQPKYFLINGQPYSAGLPPMPAGNPTDRVLIRFLNAGLETHVPVLNNLYMSVIAEDGYPYKHAKMQYSLILPALKTKDAVITPAAAGTYPVYDRRLRLTNAGASPGGMLTFLSVGN